MQRLTGAPLTGKAWVADLAQPLDEKLRAERAEYDAGLAAQAAAGAALAAEVDLQMRVTIMDGDATLADTEADGGFTGMCATFAKAIEARASPYPVKA